ncbi:Ig-like domain-containing protein [Aeromonas rivuli]|uniref:Ig-like domain-containing protein n=1 Tax=Aeromonas rivuli TaxID=648794 RepID=UPI0009FC5E2E|nr:Ig-like domain-containing protein [Aeromonas rivuli]
MKLIKLCFLSLFAMVLTACGGEGSGLPSQGGGDGGETVPAIVSLQVTPATATVPVGFEQQYLALAALDDGSVMDVTSNPVVRWSTSDSSIATINNTGLATGLAPGEVIITASGTANNVPFERKVTLTVTNAVVTALQVTPATATVPVGFEQAFTAIATFSDGSALDVTRQSALAWSSSDATVATIDSSKGKKGHATGVAPGTVTITAAGTTNGIQFSATAQLEVTNATVTALRVTPATASVPVGLEQPFMAIATLSDGSTLNVTDNAALSWTSSGSGIATIVNKQPSGNGVATGVTPGTTTITASGTVNDTPFSATAQLEVTNAVITALQVTPISASIPAGFTQAFTAVAALSDGTYRDVTRNSALNWTSDNAEIATIENNRAKKGHARGITSGTVTITASGTTNGTSFSETAQLEVTSAVVTALKVTPSTASVSIGSTQNFTAKAELSDGSTLDVTNNAALGWSSNDPTKATVSSNQSNSNGIATGLVEGDVTIKASGFANGTQFNGVAQLTVLPLPPSNLAYTLEPVDRNGGNGNSISWTWSKDPLYVWEGAKIKIIVPDAVGSIDWSTTSPFITLNGNIITINSFGVSDISGTDEAQQTISVKIQPSYWVKKISTEKNGYYNATVDCQSAGGVVASKDFISGIYSVWGNMFIYEPWTTNYIFTSTPYPGTTNPAVDRWAFWAETNSWSRDAWSVLAYACQ